MSVYLAGGSIIGKSGSVFSTAVATGGFAPNKPAGLSVIVDRQWNPTDPTIPGGVLPPASLTGTDSTGMQWTPQDGKLPIIDTPANLTTTIGATIPAVPDGNPTVMAVKYPSAFPAGHNPFGVFANTVPLSKRMYVCCYAIFPTNYNSNGNNNKWVFFAQNGTNGRNHVYMLSSGSPGTYRGPWMATQGGGGSFNVGGNASNKPGALVNLASPTISNDSTWHVFEWYSVLETVPGTSADGIYQAWIDGTLIGSWNNLNYNAVSGDPAGFDTCYFAPYYGGGGSAAPADEYVGIGRFYCAGGN